MLSTSDQDAQFAAALENSQAMSFWATYFSIPSVPRARPQPEKEHFNIVWAKAFPQVLKGEVKRWAGL